MKRTLLFCACLLLPVWLLPLFCRAELPRWDTARQGTLITSLTADAQGRVWAGTEERGVWTASPSAPDKGWTQYGVKDGLGEDSVTALVCDAKGRIWAGERSRGVAVFNGRVWRNYDAVSGPLGRHVFALAVSPKDGDVWLATDAGLTRYSQGKDTWRDYTRAGGLPSGQVQALAFDPKGILYIGTQADGLAVAAAADDYASWRTVPGQSSPSPFPSGAGFPDRRITALLVAHDGSVYAGTPSGLVGSQDGGKTWRYLRGGDWLAKAQGRAGYSPDTLTPDSAPTLAEDYVSALAEDSRGRLWIGHNHQGVEVVDPQNSGHAPVAIFPQPSTDDVRCLLAPAGPSVLVGGYGSGLALAPSTDPSAPAWAVRPALVSAALPSPAAAPTVAELKALLASVSAAALPLKPGDGLYLGDDWQTQGDWVGRYGRQYAELSGIADEAQEAGYFVSEQIGPHHAGTAGVYTYGIYSFISALNTPERRFLYAPSLGHRRADEINDGSWQGDKYPATFDGPDLWVSVTVPAGEQRVSFYFVNNDGHEGIVRQRNYLLELKPDKPTLDAEDRAPALASAQVTDFYTGVYKQFLVMGPGRFHFKIGRSYSSCTKLQGVFLDRVPEGPGSVDRPPPGSPSFGLIDLPLVNPDPNGQPRLLLSVAMVFRGSPAETAGFKFGDVLVSADGHPLTDPGSLNQVLDAAAGSPLAFVVKRGRQMLTLTAAQGPYVGGYGVSIPHSLPPAFAAYAPPAVPPPAPNELDTLTAARALWTALDTASGSGSTTVLLTRGRTLAYRAALAAGAPPALLANWRWYLLLWSDADRAGFDAAMSSAAKTRASR